MKKKPVLGVGSLVLVGVAVGMSIFILLRISLVWSLVYLVGLVLGGYFVVSRYCAKCACKECCPHVIIGRLARRFDRQPGPYSRSELSGLTISILFIIGVPLIWLISEPLMLALYLGLNAVSVTLIWIWICKSCANLHCPLRAARLKGGRS
jgi:hypothetical protein